jgi:hypothetical protein
VAAGELDGAGERDLEDGRVGFVDGDFDAGDFEELAAVGVFAGRDAAHDGAVEVAVGVVVGLFLLDDGFEVCGHGWGSFHATLSVCWVRVSLRPTPGSHSDFGVQSGLASAPRPPCV